MWMAGGGIKGGTSVGETDEFSRRRGDPDPCCTSGISASRTALNQLGLDPNHLTYFYGGLKQKLVGVEGAQPIRQIIA